MIPLALALSRKGRGDFLPFALGLFQMGGLGLFGSGGAVFEGFVHYALENLVGLRAGEEEVVEHEGGDAVNAVAEGFVVLRHDSFGVFAGFQALAQFGAVEADAAADVGEDGRVAEVGALVPIGDVGGVVILHELALLLGELGGLQRQQAVVGVAGRAHHDVCFAGVGAQWFGQFVVGFTGARVARTATLRGIGAQEIGPAFDGDVVFFFQLVDAFQADVAPRSNIVVPDDDVDRVWVVGMAVCGRLSGHGGAPLRES